MFGRYRKQRLDAQAVKIRHMDFLFGTIYFVHGVKHRLVGDAQQFDNIPVKRGNTPLAVQQRNDHIGIFNGLKDLEANFLPEWEKRYPGLQHGSVGQAEGEARFIKEVLGLYMIAFFVMYAMLAIAFHSYWQPILILIAMPYAYVGAIYGHAMLGMTMAIFSYFGIAAAAGVVVNDNLVLIDYTNRLREKGMKPLEAIIEAVRGDRARLTSEAADVLFHLLVMLRARDVPLADVMAELARRQGQSGLQEKASRS